VVLAGMFVGSGLTVLYAIACGANIRVGQAMIASYFAISLLLILRGFDRLLQRAVAALFRVNRNVEKPPLAFHLRAILASLTRMVVLFGVGMPYVMATVMTYRPKVELRDDPQKQLGFKFEQVEFTATDGTKLSGWWMPAEHPRSRFRRGESALAGGTDTVLICHGLASNKSNQLILARGFVPYGMNALIFDFRAHGASGGQLSSFGDLERRDVLGAVRWIRAWHPDEARRIFGVGASMGAAALIAAAADSSPEGQAIDAVAVYGTFDNLPAELRDVADERFIEPLAWLIDHLGLPLASVQVGSNLSAFSPATLVHDLWPRPILIIHGVNDPIIAFDRGRSLFDHAQQPKTRIWLDGGGHNDIIHDEQIAEVVRDFFRRSRPVPVI
jgi:uncharacterized protein